MHHPDGGPCVWWILVNASLLKSGIGKGADAMSTHGRASETPLGRLLLDSRSITEHQLDGALKQQAARGGRLGEVLQQMGYADARSIRQALVHQRRLVKVDLQETPAQGDAIALLPAEVASKYRVLPLAVDNGRVRLAMADPFDRQALDVARLLTRKVIDPVYAEEKDLVEAIGRAYGSNVARMIANLDEADVRASIDTSADTAAHLIELAREPTIVNLVDLVIHEAIEARASDIHIEPFEKVLKIKYRIDGLLHEMSPPPKHLQSAITSRVKIMGGMNIAERFVPQDGHIDFNSPRGKIDLRVATIPTVYGESVVMRILDRTAALFGLDELGLPQRQLEQYKHLLQRPHGIVLVTGPTGSGKTTTLYASLSHIYTPTLKIITIEDPVEYRLEGINQIPVNPKRGLGFADGLRAILRQDPDVVMVGEIRDRETADISIRSALTGHMVFSTLHTNDASGAIARLIDMGVEPFLIASSLQAVLAQRLVRRICPSCKRPTQPAETVLQRLGHRVSEGSVFYEGAGCRDCRQTGYRGRMGIYELLLVTDAIEEAIGRRASSSQIAAIANEGHVPMIEDGYRKAAAGHTTLSEVLRVTQEG